ncbi:MAG: hypothetical protein IJY27_01025, partial [Clostridia bacterium]|nr:hypothetical protein [Clostridia bacterium]
AATERAFISIDLTLSVAFGDSSPPGRAFCSVVMRRRAGACSRREKRANPSPREGLDPPVH